MRALSLTQPWAWLVVHGGKHVENRLWNTKFRGRFVIHAARAMTAEQYECAKILALRVGGTELTGRMPPPGELERGGIVGVAELVHVLFPVLEPTEPWHLPGQFGFVLTDVEPVRFHPCKGSLGFWGEFGVRDGRVEGTAP